MSFKGRAEALCYVIKSPWNFAGERMGNKLLKGMLSGRIFILAIEYLLMCSDMS